MSTKEIETQATTAEAGKPAEIPWTDKQLARLHKLQTNARIAEAVLQGHVDGLAEEYELDQSKQWTMGPKGFVEVLPPDGKGKTPPSGDSASNGAQGDDGEGSEGQTPPTA